MDTPIKEKVKAEEKSTEDIRIENEKNKLIDFKMVTFTLAGKDYGIDIMKVKEISKVGKFTFVPNTAPYVRGVYNLRGDIISVVDLRVFFNLEYMRSEEDLKQVNMIILRLEDRVLSVIVDSIDKVVGISKENIQPPHPLFGDINIKYISGIVEQNDRLYILLDVDKIFTTETLEKERAATPETEIPVETASTEQGAINRVLNDRKVQEKTEEIDDVNLGFIKETLTTFKKFYPSPLNEGWIKSRFKEWNKLKDGKHIQLEKEEDANEYLAPFLSPFTSRLWDKDYIEGFSSLLPDSKKGNFNVWNPGCGTGFETYSIAVALKKKYPDAILKIRGNDSDLISISMAPGLVIDKSMLQDVYQGYTVEGPKGVQLSGEIKDLVIFEYHDLAHPNTLPPLDLVVARDTLSFLPVEVQESLIESIHENLKPGGFFVLGKNEVLSDAKKWDKVEKKGFIAYKKK